MTAHRELAERYGRAVAHLERARQEADEALRRALAAGLSQREIGRIVGRSQPEVRRRLLRARPARTWPTAAEYGHGIATELESGDTEFAFRLIQQALATAEGLPTTDLPEFADRKPLTGDLRWDTLLLGALRAVLERRGHHPRWGRPDPLPEPWFVVPDPALRARTRRLADPNLADLNVWVDTNSLRTA